MLGPSTPLSRPRSVLGRPRLCHSGISQTTLGTGGALLCDRGLGPSWLQPEQLCFYQRFHCLRSSKGWKRSCSFHICFFLASKSVWQKSKGADVRNTEKGVRKAAVHWGGDSITPRGGECVWGRVRCVHVCTRVHVCACTYVVCEVVCVWCGHAVCVCCVHVCARAYVICEMCVCGVGVLYVCACVCCVYITSTHMKSGRARLPQDTLAHL